MPLVRRHDAIHVGTAFNEHFLEFASPGADIRKVGDRDASTFHSLQCIGRGPACMAIACYYKALAEVHAVANPTFRKVGLFASGLRSVLPHTYRCTRTSYSQVCYFAQPYLCWCWSRKLCPHFLCAKLTMWAHFSLLYTIFQLKCVGHALTKPQPLQPFLA
jgi:hypothetical protein